MIRLTFFASMTVLLFSCSETQSSMPKHDNKGDAVYGIEAEDEEMNRAIQQAKKTYGDFLAAFARQPRGTVGYAVKMRFGYANDGVEHMWLGELFEKEDKFYGKLLSYPIHVDRLKWGDHIEIIKDSLSDWMYIHHKKLVGGYTIRALYNKMNEKEKEAYRKEASFDIE